MEGETERTSIPKQLSARGEIETFLKELQRTGVPWNTLKLVFLGHGEIGKTTLLNAIRIVQQEEREKKKWFFERV